MSTTQFGKFKIKRVSLVEEGCTYEAFKVTGRIDGQRIRKQFRGIEKRWARGQSIAARGTIRL